MKKVKNIIPAILRYLAAIVLIQTLYFKFTAHPESVYIFSTLGLEPYGRVGIGILELIAAGLLLYNRLAWTGAILGIGLMSGAVFFHLTALGIQVNNDGGMLFSLALLVLLCCLGTLYFQLYNVPFVGKWIAEKG